MNISSASGRNLPKKQNNNLTHNSPPKPGGLFAFMTRTFHMKDKDNESSEYAASMSIRQAVEFIRAAMGINIYLPQNGKLKDRILFPRKTHRQKTAKA